MRDWEILAVFAIGFYILIRKPKGHDLNTIHESKQEPGFVVPIHSTSQIPGDHPSAPDPVVPQPKPSASMAGVGYGA